MPLFGSPNIRKLKEKRDVDGLIKALSYQKDRQIGKDAAIALGELKDTRAVGPLINSLQDFSISDQVVDALGEIGAPAVEQLRGMGNALPLTAVTRNKAEIELLGRIGNDRAVELLIEGLNKQTEPPDVNCREAIIEVLGRIGSIQAKQCLVDRLRERGVLRDSVVAALDKAGWQPAQDEDGARYWIAKKAWEKCVEIGAPAIKPLINVFYEKSNSYDNAARAIREIGTPAVEPLIAILKDSNVFAHTYAIRLLGKIGDSRAIKALSEYILLLWKYSDQDQVKFQMGYNLIGEALVELMDVQPVEALIAALQDRVPLVRLKAIKALGNYKDTRVIEPLITALGDSEYYIRIEAAKTLGEYKDPRLVTPFITALRDGNKEVRHEATQVLGELKDDRAVEPIIASIESSFQNFESADEAAFEALGKIGNTRAVKYLVYSLTKQVRTPAVDALDKIGWKPGKDEASAYYWLVKGNLDNCIQIGAPAVVPLVEDSHLGSEEIVEALVKIGEPAVEPLMVQSEKLCNTRRTAEALGRIGDRRAVKPLIYVLTKQVSEEVAEALDRLGWQPGKDQAGAYYWIAKENWEEFKKIGAPFIEQLISECGSPWAAEALSKLGDPAVEQLIASFEKTPSDSKIEALGRIGSNRTISLLISRLLLATKKEEKPIRIKIAKVLIQSYKESQLVEVKKLILDHRAEIRIPHEDYGGFEVCGRSWPHEDFPGLDFPL